MDNGIEAENKRLKIALDVAISALIDINTSNKKELQIFGDRVNQSKVALNDIDEALKGN